MGKLETLAIDATETVSWRVNRWNKRFTVERCVGGEGDWESVFLCPTKTAALTVLGAVTSNRSVPAAGIWNWTRDIDPNAVYTHYKKAPKVETEQRALEIVRVERQVVAHYDLWVGDSIRTYYFLIVGDDELLNSPLFDDQISLARFYLIARAKQVLKGVFRYCYTKSGDKLHWSLALSDLPERNMTICGGRPVAWVSSGFDQQYMCKRCEMGRRDG